MSCRLSPAAIFATLLSTGSAFADTWAIDDGQDRNGVTYTHAELVGAEHAISLSCQQNRPDEFHFLMITGDLPGLPAIDDQTADITVTATSGGDQTELSFSPWYFEPDRAWTGKLAVTKAEAKALFEAESLTLTTPNKETIVTFSPEPVAEDTEIILSQCTFTQ